MTKNKEQKKQKKVQSDSEACDHVGYYIGFGFETLKMDDGSIWAISALDCMMCGKIFYPKTLLFAPDNKVQGPEINA